MTETYPAVTELLPHAGPAVLIDQVLADSPDVIRCAAHITARHPFFVPGEGVPAWVGIELMAQAIAAHAGLAARREQKPPNAGMLLGTRKFEAGTPWFREGAILEVRAEREFGEPGGIAACACTILSDGQTLARASIIIIEVDGEKLS
jgi:predicted hotdog family 3-hydroxylacyl-ACP dehydratase